MQSAKDIDLLVKQHRRGVGSRYTKPHRPKKLVYSEEFHTRGEVMKREGEIKQLSREEKYELVSSHSR